MFLMTVAVLGAIQYFVFSQLRRYVRSHFAHKADILIRRFKWLFLLMNIPILFIYFRREIASDLPLVTNIVLYPYTIWVFLLMCWTVILIPIVLARMTKIVISNKRSS